MSTVSKSVDVDMLMAEIQRLKVENKFLSKECERHQHEKSELRKELELQKNQASRILHEATAEVEQRYEEAEAARRGAEEEVQQLRGRVAKLRRRVQCMFGQVGIPLGACSTRGDGLAYKHACEDAGGRGAQSSHTFRAPYRPGPLGSFITPVIATFRTVCSA